jgi:hypothetical protein
MERREILEKIEELINLLSSPLDASEIKNGWDAELQTRWKLFYQNMYEYIKTGKPLSKKPEYTSSICRALDFSGIMKGKFFDYAIDIECRLREIKNKERSLFSKFTKFLKGG